MTKKTENKMRIWEQVCKTDPRFTKEKNFGRKETSINPQYQKRMLTEVFGPCGSSWGLDVHNWEHLKDESGKIYFVILYAEFWYIENNERKAFSITRGKEFGIKDDTHTKLQTSCISKACSYLGFNSDVFYGHFDNVDYTDSMKAEKAKDKQDSSSRIAQIIKEAEDMEHLKEIFASLSEKNKAKFKNQINEMKTKLNGSAK